MKASMGEAILVCLAFMIMAIILCQMFPNLWIFFIIVAIVVIVLIVVRKSKAQGTRSHTAGNVDYSLYTKVVGVTFNGIQSILPTLHSGMQLDFVREPYNTHDSNAIAVKCRGENIGHLSAELAAELAPLMDSGISVDGEIKNITGGGGLSYGCNIEVFVYKSKTAENCYKPKKYSERALPQPKSFGDFNPDEESYSFLPFLYRESLVIKSRQEISKRATKIKPNKCRKRKFVEEPVFSEESVKREVLSEAVKVITDKFQREKKIRRYIENNFAARMELRRQEHNQWEHDKLEFEKAEKEYEEKCNKIYELDAQNEVKYIQEQCEANGEYISSKAKKRLEKLKFPYELNPIFSYNEENKSAYLTVDLPKIEDIPQGTTQKETKFTFVNISYSVAVYVATIIFDISPNVEKLTLTEKAARRDTNGELKKDYVFSVKFTREPFEKIAKWNEIDLQNFCMQFENRCNITATGIMKAIKPYEQV